MIGFLRLVGVLNAAVWFGAAVFFTFWSGSAPFSLEMRRLLGDNNYPYFSGAIAQILIARYFSLQFVCSIVAVLHLVAEWLYLGRFPQNSRLALLVALCLAVLLGGYWLQPRMKALHATKYAANQPARVRESAARSFRAWHGVSMGVNLLVVAGLAVYVWRVANPSDETRFVSAVKFRS
ncbi:MAG TPA: DUF4149 domain-containing protein [Candidatus Acidoferrum sp.]|nr:DUF4149 domain-containing protein [Candidatus Acidoferrum sp.]